MSYIAVGVALVLGIVFFRHFTWAMVVLALLVIGHQVVYWIQLERR